MAVLLAALILLILASPFADVAGGSRLAIAGATVAFLIACLQQARTHTRLRLPARIMVLLWLLLNLPTRWSDQIWMEAISSATLAILNLGVLWLVAQHVIRADRVDAELLCSALGAYLLLGVFWAETYEIINLCAPTAFAKSGEGALRQGALIYFSFTTLTTTGYGDILAVSPIARMWAVFEAIVGTMYNATVIAWLVSLYGRSIMQQDQAGHSDP
jgi:hypothetical protein